MVEKIKFRNSQFAVGKQELLVFYFSLLLKKLFHFFKYGWFFHRDKMLLDTLIQCGIKLFNPKIFSEQHEGPLTSSCAVWSIIFYLYFYTLLVTLYLSDTCDFDCAFL